MAIKIYEVDVGDVYCQYPTQSEAQPCYVELDLRDGTLTASYDSAIGGGAPFSVWHGHIRRYDIANLKPSRINALLEEIAPLAERVLAGYESHWNGSNSVARLTADAAEADADIAAACWRTGEDEDDLLQVWDAGAWLLQLDSAESVAADLGITAETTDSELETIASRVTCDAESYADCDVLAGCEDTLHWIREELREGQ